MAREEEEDEIDEEAIDVQSDDDGNLGSSKTVVID